MGPTSVGKKQVNNFETQTGLEHLKRPFIHSLIPLIYFFHEHLKCFFCVPDKKKYWDTYLNCIKILNENPRDKNVEILVIQKWYIKNNWAIAVTVHVRKQYVFSLF